MIKIGKEIIGLISTVIGIKIQMSKKGVMADVTS